jgi:hypothetical protein
MWNALQGNSLGGSTVNDNVEDSVGDDARDVGTAVSGSFGRTGPSVGGPMSGGRGRGFDSGRGGGGGRGGLERDVKGKDWECPSCTNVNWSWRSTCNKCNTAKPATAGALVRVCLIVCSFSLLHSVFAESGHNCLLYVYLHRYLYVTGRGRQQRETAGQNIHRNNRSRRGGL